MADLGKFSRVAKEYSEKFGFDPYYTALMDLLEKYCPNVRLVLEIGAANGIMVEKWDNVRKMKQNKGSFDYYSVEPVKEAVQIAQKKSPKLDIRYHPFVGVLANALEVCDLVDKKIDLLITSRSLHEIYLSYEKNLEKVFLDVNAILKTSKPHCVVHGIVERFTGLTPDETKRFIKAQTEKIGHGHDPAVDYLDFATLVSFMKSAGYTLIDSKKISQPLAGFKISPWNFRIGVFESN